MPRLAQFTLAALLLATLALAAPPGARAADFVIIDSTDSALAAGAVVSGGATLTVAAGAKVVLISDSGERKEVSGPFSGSLDGGGGGGGGKAGVASALSQLIAGRSASTNFVGATRSATASAPDSPYAIEPARADDHCAPPGGAPDLQRKPSRKSMKISLKHVASKAEANVKWPPGVAVIPWPGEVPLVDGDTYVAKIGRKSAKFVLHRVPEGLVSDAHRAVWMAEHGCEVQARMLIAAMR
ncbi:MAG: hypothetical protein H6907_18300 [Hyphomicrobiales bacterium]|nr:hypothetical protein [Hyphomicrobiales bacterium]MCP5373686.1 hypothetical protein [Hyphomicrobiales bacterium]